MDITLGNHKRDQKVVAPVSVQDVVRLYVDRLGYRGEGVARHQGFTIFVEGALPGEIVDVQIAKVQRTFAVGKLHALIETSAQRVKPKCEVFDLCGGCQLQHVSYQTQLEFKQQTVKDALIRIGKFPVDQVEEWVLPTIGQEDPWRYRNKVSLMATARSGRFIAGFVEEGTHEPVEAQTCFIRPQAYDALLRTLMDLFSEFGIRAYDEKIRQGDVQQLVVRSNSVQEMMIVIITPRRHFPNATMLCEKLAESMPMGYRLRSVIQQQMPRATAGFQTARPLERVLFGEPHMHEQIAGLSFRISASAFFQVNPLQTLVLYERALEVAQISAEDTVFDLFSGVGTLSLLAAKFAKYVYGIESVIAATEDAIYNAEQNGLMNTQFFTGFVEEIVPQLVFDHVNPDIVFLDPPRAGCALPVLSSLVEATPRKIVYVSCNPATLARDLRHLVDGGYAIQSIQPVDMFPQTAHVEVITSMFLDKSRGH